MSELPPPTPSAPVPIPATSAKRVIHYGTLIYMSFAFEEGYKRDIPFQAEDTRHYREYKPILHPPNVIFQPEYNRIPRPWDYHMLIPFIYDKEKNTTQECYITIDTVPYGTGGGRPTRLRGIFKRSSIHKHLYLFQSQEQVLHNTWHSILVYYNPTFIKDAARVYSYHFGCKEVAEGFIFSEVYYIMTTSQNPEVRILASYVLEIEAERKNKAEKRMYSNRNY